MSETKFIKEPWYKAYAHEKTRGVRTKGGFICFLTKPHHYSGQDERYESELEENKANQDLIAAAPELYEALAEYLYHQRRMLEKWADGDENVKADLWKNLHACEDKADKALAKARGESEK